MSRLSFAVVLTWPELKNAEYEVVQRICRAAANIGALAWVVDNDGYVLWSSADSDLCSKRRVTREDCAFVLSLHFESPRLYDIPSYTALWNPPDFYVGFGYARTIAQLASHVDVLSCRSDVADAHAANVYAGLGRALLQPFPPFFHGVPRPYLEPRQSEASRLFYVGINWERVTGEKGRHHDLLKQLDAEDLISIYGPEKLFGIAPWRGFETYRGSIPFDGESVVARINEAGICLALSSRAHQVSGIMSNRLFEALAAGAVIIANPHPFIDAHFADVAYVVDDRRPVEEMVAAIRDLVLRIRANPAEARARARLGQARLAEAFSLEDNLRNLFAAHGDRQAHFKHETMGAAPHEVSVVLDATGLDAASVGRLLGTIAAQIGVSIDLLVLGGPELADRVQGMLGQVIRSAQLFPVALDVQEDGKLLRRTAASGRAFARALDAVRTPFFCTVQADDDWFSEHLATLAHTLDRASGSSFACSGKLVEQIDKHDLTRRQFDSLTFEHFEALVEVAYPRDVGRFLFRSALIAKLPQRAFALLDTLEHRMLTLWAFLDGPPAQTRIASYIRALDVTEDLPAPFFAEAQQQEIIRDTVRGRQDWLTLASTLRQFRPQATVAPKPSALRLGRTYALRKGGDGQPLLQQGFSVAEETGVWVEGREGVLAFSIADAETPERAEIVLYALGRPADADGAPQWCSVVVNGHVAGRVVVGPQAALFRIPVPAAVDLHPSVSVALRLRHADQVFDATGAVVDERRLGLHLISFGLEAAAAQAPILTFDHSYALNEDGDGLSFAVEGFSLPERDVVWAIGPAATLAFTPEASAQELTLRFVAMRRHAHEDTTLAIRLDGSVIGRVSVPAHLERKTIALPALHGGRPYRLTLALDGAQGGVALQYFGLFRPAPKDLRRMGRATARRVLDTLPPPLRRRLG